MSATEGFLARQDQERVAWELLRRTRLELVEAVSAGFTSPPEAAELSSLTACWDQLTRRWQAWQQAYAALDVEDTSGQQP